MVTLHGMALSALRIYPSRPLIVRLPIPPPSSPKVLTFRGLYYKLHLLLPLLLLLLLPLPLLLLLLLPLLLPLPLQVLLPLQLPLPLQLLLQLLLDERKYCHVCSNIINSTYFCCKGIVNACLTVHPSLILLAIV